MVTMDGGLGDVLGVGSAHGWVREERTTRRCPSALSRANGGLSRSGFPVAVDDDHGSGVAWRGWDEWWDECRR